MISCINFWHTSKQKKFKAMHAFYLRVLSIPNVLLPVKEPIWNLVLTRVLHDGNYSFHL